jgi:hypothetical protein
MNLASRINIKTIRQLIHWSDSQYSQHRSLIHLNSPLLIYAFTAHSAPLTRICRPRLALHSIPSLASVPP